MRVALLLPLLLAAACTLPGSAAPVLKLGVIAPFEGQERELGYAILPVIKEVVAEANASGELGPYRVLVVAFNDNFEIETARQQAEALAVDPSVFGVIGPLTVDAGYVISPILAHARIRHMPLPEAKHFSDLKAEVRKATKFLLDGLAADIRQFDRPIGPQPARP